MTHKNERHFEALKSESARQRWELFHRAIAHAKQSNAAMQEAEALQGAGSIDKASDKPERSDPLLSIAR
ncbi:MAG: hypothetical protein ACREQ8_08020 [Woeseiaceae bacterium]